MEPDGQLNSVVEHVLHVMTGYKMEMKLGLIVEGLTALLALAVTALILT